MTIPGILSPAVPYGSMVVVSGATGFIGSHVADQLILAGYNVRGTTRNAHKGGWLAQYFHRKYGSDRFELNEVSNMADTNSFHEIAKGASGFVHVAHDMGKSTDSVAAQDLAVAGALNALKASADMGLKRFVYTSSSFAATQPKPGKIFNIPIDGYNEEAVARASQGNADGETVYAASKVATERAISKWIKENKPSLVVNTVLPNGNIGPLISSGHQGYPTSARWVKALWERDYESLRGTPPQHFVNVQDDARLHVIALAHSDLSNERIFAIAGPVSLNAIIGILRKLRPDQTWEDFPDNEEDLSTFEGAERALQLHSQAYHTGFIDLSESVKANAADLLS